MSLNCNRTLMTRNPEDMELLLKKIKVAITRPAAVNTIFVMLVAKA